MMGPFYTEPEAAEILRCSKSKIKRLRLSGKLAYVSGRPVLISEAAINAFIEAVAKAATPPPPEVSTSPPPPPPDPLEERKQLAMDARKWALQELLLKPGSRAPNGPASQKRARRR